MRSTLARRSGPCGRSRCTNGTQGKGCCRDSEARRKADGPGQGKGGRTQEGRKEGQARTEEGRQEGGKDGQEAREESGKDKEGREESSQEDGKEGGARQEVDRRGPELVRSTELSVAGVDSIHIRGRFA